MICKDCLATLSPDGTVDYIELCPRHAAMEDTLLKWGEVIANAEEERAERRRLALLQAATLLLGFYRSEEDAHRDVAWWSLRGKRAVDVAEALLAEIEKREPEKQS